MRRVDEAYRELAAIFAQRVVVLDGKKPPHALALEDPWSTWDLS